MSAYEGWEDVTGLDASEVRFISFLPVVQIVTNLATPAGPASSCYMVRVRHSSVQYYQGRGCAFSPSPFEARCD